MGKYRDHQRLKIFRNTKVATIDRKSTRLNSSHLVISYAVFCLKKKKIHRAAALSFRVLFEFFVIRLIRRESNPWTSSRPRDTSRIWGGDEYQFTAQRWSD